MVQAYCVSSLNYLPLLPSGPDGVGQSAIAQGLKRNTKGEAEREGFEPSVPGKEYTRFPSVHLRPLGHLSGMTTPFNDFCCGERGIRTPGPALNTQTA